MTIGDIGLRSRVRFALVRDPRVSALDIHVVCADGVVTLMGDLDSAEERAAAEAIVRSVPGVTGVHNDLTVGVGELAETADLLTQRLLEKLDTEWRMLTSHDALAEADYVQWALWLIYKFRMPGSAVAEPRTALETAAVDAALTQLSGYIHAPKVVLAVLMLREAETVALTPNVEKPDILNAQLKVSAATQSAPTAASA